MALSFQQLLTAVPLVLKGGHVPTIVGQAGVGKSALVETVAEKMGAKLVTTVVSLSEKGDLAIPIPPLNDQAYVTTQAGQHLADVQFGYTHTLIEIIQAAEKHPKQPIIWFLDEFNRGNSAVQAELMNLVLQRQINDIQLPKNTYIVLAENPDDTMAGFEEDQYAVEPADAAIKDRTTRLVMDVSVTDWLNWAKQGQPQAHIDPLIQRFIAANSQLLYPSQRSGDLDPTPRAWQRFSDNYRQLKKLPAQQQNQLLFDLAAGDLGPAVAALVTKFLQENEQVLTAADLFDSQPQGRRVPGKIVAIFKKLPALQQLNTLKSALNTADLTDNNRAARFSYLLNQLAPDSQYALVQQLVNDPVLDKLYASKNHYANVLYQQIMDIATH
ncbi:AAA family ATPase [Lactobacillaceae bacterium L1_55_11]|nr:AAA family ATPase [Lactobacillaceae bacterium L1_55_11]